jgi:glutamate dehydrogenase
MGKEACMSTPKWPPLSSQDLKKITAFEAQSFEKTLRWLEAHMPPSFLNEADPRTRTLLARALLSFSLQEKFCSVHLKGSAFICCMDGPDADLNILKHYTDQSIRYYRTFVSNQAPPGERKGLLRIAVIYFQELDSQEKLSFDKKEALFRLMQSEKPDLKEDEFQELLRNLSPKFFSSMSEERLKICLRLFFKAQGADQCQYEIKKNEDWEAKGSPSVQLVMAWKNVPRAGFFYKLAQIIRTHQLCLQRSTVNSIGGHSPDNILIISLGLHGLNGDAAWKATDLDDFLREIVLTKYFDIDDAIGTVFVLPKVITGNEGHLIRNMVSFVHQILVYADPNLYSFENTLEGFCRHPELTQSLCHLFQTKFHPEFHNISTYHKERALFLEKINALDTGQQLNDWRRKNILRQGLSFIDHCLKTNFYRKNKTSFSFRLNPKYLDEIPYERKEKFPEIPYGIFFIRGMHFIGFNIRFKDLARGGLRTVLPERKEQFITERNNIFSEAYNLAYTQQKKNKDIPEGGSKTAILLEPPEIFQREEMIYRKELQESGIIDAIIEEKLNVYRKEQKTAYINSSQRCFIESFMTLIHCKEDGTLYAGSIIDYWKKPEYIYLGPDENISNEMIVWIADFAQKCHYKPGRSFMSSKPGAGINHKEYGVTSYGLHVYLEQALIAIGINPLKEPFRVKFSGGPDGDVAGNEIHNLYRFFPNTAKIVALTDGSGTIHDPQGLDLHEMELLFQQGQPIRFYPPEKLHDGGFLLDIRTKKEESSYAQLILLWKKKHGKAIQEWISGSEMNLLYRNNVHQVEADVFITGGGRPRTLNENNYENFLNRAKIPTAKAIVEGANLYLTREARIALESMGTLIFKDSSCNKGGVITSSFEVLAGLCMNEEEFMKEKNQYIQEVLEIIKHAALNEASTLLKEHKKTGHFLTEISDQVSEKINFYKYQLLGYLETIDLPKNPKDPLIQCLIHYCPPLLQKKHLKRILSIPEIHKKAIIACYLAARLIYRKGLHWTPSIADILPLLTHDPDII